MSKPKPSRPCYMQAQPTSISRNARMTPEVGPSLEEDIKFRARKAAESNVQALARQLKEATAHAAESQERLQDATKRIVDLQDQLLAAQQDVGNSG